MEKYRAQTNWASWHKGVKRSQGLKSGENGNLIIMVKIYSINSLQVMRHLNGTNSNEGHQRLEDQQDWKNPPNRRLKKDFSGIEYERTSKLYGNGHIHWKYYWSNEKSCTLDQHACRLVEIHINTLESDPLLFLIGVHYFYFCESLEH